MPSLKTLANRKKKEHASDSSSSSNKYAAISPVPSTTPTNKKKQQQEPHQFDFPTFHNGSNSNNGTVVGVVQYHQGNSANNIPTVNDRDHDDDDLSGDERKPVHASSARTLSSHSHSEKGSRSLSNGALVSSTASISQSARNSLVHAKNHANSKGSVSQTSKSGEAFGTVTNVVSESSSPIVPASPTRQQVVVRSAAEPIGTGGRCSTCGSVLTTQQFVPSPQDQHQHQEDLPSGASNRVLSLQSSVSHPNGLNTVATSGVGQHVAVTSPLVGSSGENAEAALAVGTLPLPTAKPDPRTTTTRDTSDSPSFSRGSHTAAATSSSSTSGGSKAVVDHLKAPPIVVPASNTNAPPPSHPIGSGRRRRSSSSSTGSAQSVGRRHSNSLHHHKLKDMLKDIHNTMDFEEYFMDLAPYEQLDLAMLFYTNFLHHKQNGSSGGGGTRHRGSYSQDSRRLSNLSTGSSPINGPSEPQFIGIGGPSASNSPNLRPVPPAAAAPTADAMGSHTNPLGHALTANNLNMLPPPALGSGGGQDPTFMPVNGNHPAMTSNSHAAAMMGVNGSPIPSRIDQQMFQSMQDMNLMSMASCTSAFALPRSNRIRQAVPEDAHGYEVLNDYTILDEIGSGASGTVMLALHSKTQDPFAIKAVSKSRKLKFGRALPTFDIEKEVAVMKKLKHPNIVRLHEVIDDPEEHMMYMVMDYVPNGPLLALKTNELSGAVTCNPIENTTRLVRYARQIAEGLRYLHRRKVVHRDIKPDNILLGYEGKVYIADFGVSEVVKSSLLNGKSNSQSTMAAKGTPAFFAPEQCRGEALTPASDVWSFGVVLYLAKFGKLPFPGKGSMTSLLNEILENDLTFPDDADPIWKDCLTKLLRKEADTRMSLKEFLSHDAVMVSTTTSPFKKATVASTTASAVSSPARVVGVTEPTENKKEETSGTTDIEAKAEDRPTSSPADELRPEPIEVNPHSPTDSREGSSSDEDIATTPSGVFDLGAISVRNPERVAFYSKKTTAELVGKAEELLPQVVRNKGQNQQMPLFGSMNTGTNPMVGNASFGANPMGGGALPTATMTNGSFGAANQLGSSNMWMPIAQDANPSASMAAFRQQMQQQQSSATMINVFGGGAGVGAAGMSPQLTSASLLSATLAPNFARRGTEAPVSADVMMRNYSPPLAAKSSPSSSSAAPAAAESTIIEKEKESKQHEDASGGFLALQQSINAAPEGELMSFVS